MKEKLKEKAEKIKTDIPAVFLALKDKRTPLTAKILAAITLVYALSPIDFIPDFIPVLGYLDDLIILPGLIAATIKLLPEEVLTECREKSKDMWQNGKPKKWYYALPFIIIWLIIILMIVKEIIKF